MFTHNLSSNSPSPALPNLLLSSNLPHQKSTSEEPSDPDTPKKAGKWTSEEDDLLRKYVSTYSEKQWKKISENIPGRTPIQCLHRWTKILKPGLVKGPWTNEEDQKLLNWIKKHGPGKWAQAASVIPGRSGKQCRERWFNNLNPDVKKGNWSAEEDQLIFDLYQKHGSSWSKISKYIPGRTENSIKNRFYSTLRKLAASKNKGNTTGSTSDNGSVQEEVLVKQEEGSGKKEKDIVPLLARNSNLQRNEDNEKTNTIKKSAKVTEDASSLLEQQKLLHNLLSLLQSPAMPPQQPLLMPPLQIPAFNTRKNEEINQISMNRDLLSNPLALPNRNNIDMANILLPMLRELNNQNKPQLPVQNPDLLQQLVKPQLPNSFNETGGLDALIKSISDDIMTASIVYSHHMRTINDMMKNMDKDNSEEAKERLNVMLRQVFGLEAWLKNAKAELTRLESLVHTQRYLAQLPIDMNIINKRKFIGDENAEQQPSKRMKIE